MTTFNEFLQEIHGEIYPSILDDDLPDHFDAWSSDIDGEDYESYAEIYGKQSFNEGMKHALNLINVKG